MNSHLIESTPLQVPPSLRFSVVLGSFRFGECSLSLEMSHSDLAIVDGVQTHIAEGLFIGEAFTLVAARTGKTRQAVQNLWREHKSSAEYFRLHSSLSPRRSLIAANLLRVLAVSEVRMTAAEARKAFNKVLDLDYQLAHILRWRECHAPFLKLRDIRAKWSNADKLDELIEWIPLARDVLEQNSPQSFELVAFNETTLHLNSAGTCALNGDLTTHETLSAKTNERCSLMPFVTSTGKTILLVVVVQGRPGEPSGFFTPERDDPRYPSVLSTKSTVLLFRTPDGKLNHGRFRKIMDEFARIWSETSDKRVVLFSDQRPHYDKETRIEMFKKGFWLCFFPTATSQFLQPLENAPFDDFDKAFHESYEKLPLPPKLSPDARYLAIVHAAVDAIRAALNSKSIVKGFNNTGIAPFDPALIRKNAENFDPEYIDSGPNSRLLLRDALATIDELLERNEAEKLERKERNRLRMPLFQGRVSPEFGEVPVTKKMKAVELLNGVVIPAVRVCPAGGCAVKHYGGKGWHTCAKCEQEFCPRHGFLYLQHVDHCTNVPEE